MLPRRALPAFLLAGSASAQSQRLRQLASDTAEGSLGANLIEVTDALLANGHSGPRFDRVIAAHRQLFMAPIPPGSNRVPVGHRTPAILVLGAMVAERALLEGSALVLASGGTALGIIEFSSLPSGGWHGC